MNPARSIVPELLTGQPAFAWIYLIGPLAGAALATGAMYLLCGPPGHDERRAARGR
jgi:aquaporin Z